MTAVGMHEYLAALRPILDRLVARQAASVQKAADLIVGSLRRGGVVQTFGSGHSEAFAMELAGRAGGLVPTNRLALRDVVIYGDAPRSLITGEAPGEGAGERGDKLERDPAIARAVYELAAPQPQDVFVMASQSGINGSVVELARLVKDRGHDLVAVTSVEHTGRVRSRHPSGLRLSDLADVVLDNEAPFGDALLPLDDSGGQRACAVSSITGALLAQMVTAEVVRRFQAAGEVPPIYLSANVPGGDEHNHNLESRYAGRIRRAA